MLEVTSAKGGQGGSTFNRHSYLTDDEALKILLNANSPQNEQWLALGERTLGIGGMTSGIQAVDAMSRATTVRTKRRMRAAPTQQKIEDEEALKTKRFWENWAVEATKNLLSNIFEDDAKRQLVFTGRCGTEPKYQMQRSGSMESIHTDISLLAFSELMPEKKRNTTKKGRKKKKPKKVNAPDAPNWEMFAKEKKGMLDRFIQADASRMEGYMNNRTGPIQNVIQRSKPTDIMPKHERKMLTRCAYSRGLKLANNSKSYSTENIISAIKNKRNFDEESDVGDRMSEDGRNLTCNINNGYDAYVNGYRYVPTGRTPSPKAITEDQAVRPDSAIAALNPLEAERGSSRCTSASSDSLMLLRHSFSKGNVNDESRASSAMATTTYRRPSNVHGLPEIDSVFNTKVNRKINATIKNLTKATGYGDRTDTCNVIEEEQGVYTDADYARHPRYPQNIRIAPSLSKVIKEDIRERMGRPRRHEIRITDIEAFDCHQPILGRSHRNLLIFNWLNEMTSVGYSDVHVPEIKDLEGNPPYRNYPEFVPGIVGETDGESEDSYRGSPMTGKMTNYTSSRYGGATNYESSRYGGTTYYEGSESEDEESDFTSDDSFYA